MVCTAMIEPVRCISGGLVVVRGYHITQRITLLGKVSRIPLIRSLSACLSYLLNFFPTPTVVHVTLRPKFGAAAAASASCQCPTVDTYEPVLAPLPLLSARSPVDLWKIKNLTPVLVKQKC